MRYAPALVILLLAALAGCQAPARRPDIPLGSWSGTGSYVIADWEKKEGEANPAPPRLVHGSYPTSLKIEGLADAPAGSVRLEILSQRGQTPPLEGDRTHLVAELVRAQPAADGTAVSYDLRRLGLSLDEKPPNMENGPDMPVEASCQVSDGEVVLQVLYMDRYVDTFRFEGDELTKDGSFHGDNGFVHWSESLRRHR